MAAAPAADSAEGQGAAGRRRGARAGWLAAVAVAIVALFLLYWREARSGVVASDAASIILQGSDMLHGNLLLHGWFTADVSFYGTELVQYMLLQTVLTTSPGLVYVAGAMTYTILVAGAGWLAKGRATGREGIVRAGIGAGVMLAPALGDFMQARPPDHLGSAVPVLVAWLVIDRCAPRWWVPVAACVLLAWGVVADPLIEITGAAAIAVACGARGGYQLLRRRRAQGEPGAAPLWFEPSLAVAAVVSVGLARLAIAAIRAAGGFTEHPVAGGFIGFTDLRQHAVVTAKGLLGLFGAAFWTETPAEHLPGWQVLFSYVHLAGVVLVAAGFVLALRRFFRADSLLTAGLAAGIILNVAAFMTSRFPTDLLSIREVSAVLPFSAAIAGRLVPGYLLAAPLRKLRPVPVLAAVGVLYAAMLGADSAAARPVTPNYQNVADWLSGHHLTNGLATGYWLSNIVTVDAKGQVKVRVAKVVNGAVARSGPWEINTQWYDPSVSTADFLLTDAGAGSGQWKTQLRAAERTFGHPARTYRFDGMTVFTWHGNILTSLRPTPGT